jgi:UDP-N-acetylmuramate--alanine ligase
MTRTFAEIAAGLAPAREARPIVPGERIHVVGIGGSASVGAALSAAAAGADVSGCDIGGASQYTDAATAAGIAIAWSHDPDHVAAADGTPRVSRVAVTKALTSVRPDHPELLAARDAGIAAESVQQVIADAAVSRGQRLVGITGTHGKSTTTGWLVHLLVAAGRDPSAFVGALLPSPLAGTPLATTTRIGSGPEFVVEADEYAGNFDPYRAWLGVAVTAEWDHPDVFADEAAVIETLASWVRRFVDSPARDGNGAGERPVLVANTGDPGIRGTAGACWWTCSTTPRPISRRTGSGSSSGTGAFPDRRPSSDGSSRSARTGRRRRSSGPGSAAARRPLSSTRRCSGVTCSSTA